MRQRKILAFLLGASTVLLVAADRAGAATVYAVAGMSYLVRYDSSDPGEAEVVARLHGDQSFVDDIDFRPSDGRLYGYNQGSGQVVTIDLDTGLTTLVSTTLPFLYGIEFDPVSDAARGTSYFSGGRNLLGLDPDTGLAGSPTPLRYAAGDLYAGEVPGVDGLAYSNSFAPSPRVGDPGALLYGIDWYRNTLVTVADAGAGELRTVGSLGLPPFGWFGTANFDIVYDEESGTNRGYLIYNLDEFYSIDLETGAATLAGRLGTQSFYGGYFGIAVVPGTFAAVPEPASLVMAGLGILGVAGLAIRRRSA